MYIIDQFYERFSETSQILEKASFAMNLDESLASYH